MKLDTNFVTIENMDGKTLIYEENDLNGADVLVRNLQGVTIHLRGLPSTLRINNLKDCTLACKKLLIFAVEDFCFCS